MRALDLAQNRSATRSRESRSGAAEFLRQEKSAGEVEPKMGVASRPLHRGTGDTHATFFGDAERFEVTVLDVRIRLARPWPPAKAAVVSFVE